MVTQLKAAAQRAPRSRHRGKQRGPLESLKQPDGTYAKSAMQRKLYASRRQFKGAQQTIDRQAVLLAQSQARAEELVEQEKTRKRSHTEQDAKFSAKNLVLTQVSQHIHSLNMQHVNLFRSTGPEPPAPYERTDVAERTSVQRHAIYLALGASKVLQPVSDRVKTRLPLRNVVEELMRVTGFDQNGVKADAQGLFDLSQAPCLELGATQDGAWKNKKGGGFLLLALKPWSLSIHITRCH
ncbi:hypothetical protein B484DRAFT_400376 [Ochromonadaceae sp. CCMP2298]|nr:hypothetical protein B484DRAFT_400376 [Ochromonadaceae sp. CCMP2298]